MGRLTECLILELTWTQEELDTEKAKIVNTLITSIQEQVCMEVRDGVNKGIRDKVHNGICESKLEINLNPSKQVH